MLVMSGLRGLGDCASNPNDPVCVAFYAAPDAALTRFQKAVTGAQVTMLDAKTASANPALPGWLTTPITPGTTATITTPGVAKPWYMTWWGMLGIAGLGFVGYKKFMSKPTKAA